MPFTQTMSWSDDLLIGDPGIDSDHREIVAIIVSIQKEIDNEFDRVRVALTLNKLFTFSALHFVREEKLMNNINYHLRQTHFDEHISIIAKMNEMRNIFERDGAVDIDVANKLCILFFSHIRQFDAPLRDYILSTDIIVSRGYDDSNSSKPH